MMQKTKTIFQLIKHRHLFSKIFSNHLSFLENPGQSVWGSITEEDEAGIRYGTERAAKHEGPIIEIGALFGHTTNLLASLKGNGVPLVAVENFRWNPFHIPGDAHRMFTKRTIRYAVDHCSTQIYDGNARDFYSENMNLKPSMIFIDAAHDYESVKKDIEWAVHSACPVVLGHDYSDFHPGVIKAVNESFGDRIKVFGSVWVHARDDG